MRYFAVLFILLPVLLRGQNTIGLPEIKNYAHETTNAGAQNWNIEQDRFGNLYFANNAGLLCYNGNEWKKYPLPNRTILRSLVIGADDKIYVGGQDALGYFFPDANGVLSYHSLLDSIPQDDRSFGDVWNIVIYQQAVFYRSTHKIFRLDTHSQKITVYNIGDESRWIYMGIYNQRLYAQNEATLQLLQFSDRQWTPAVLQPRQRIRTLLPYGTDTALVVSWKKGLFLASGEKTVPLPVDPAIIQKQVFTACSIAPGTVALGTVSDGIYFIDRNGHTVRHFSTHDGMQNNNIHSLFIDRESNLWAGLDEGIDMIHYNSPIQKIKPVYENAGSAYAIRIVDGKLFIGTAERLYYTPLSIPATQNISLSTNQFLPVPHSEGQIWNIDTFNNMLLMGHHDGVFAISDGNARFINGDQNGVWLFRKLAKPGYLVAGTYDGLQLFRQQNGKLESLPLYNNLLNEPLRFIEVDNRHNIVWAAHPYRGIYRIQLSAGYDSVTSIRLFTQKDGLPDKLDNYVFRINGELAFATGDGVYEFDEATERFRPAARFSTLLGHIAVRYMVSDATGKIWFVTNKKLGVVDNNKVRYFPELEGKVVSGFENIYPYNDNNILIASYKGIIHLNYSQYEKKQNNLAARLTRVLTHQRKDSLLFNDYFVYQGKLLDHQATAGIPSLAPGFSSFHFEYTSNQLREAGKILYSYRLRGLDDEWSGWSYQTFKDYTNLPYGDYSFEVRVKDNLGNTSAPVSYAFEILPRWYQTWWAWIGYLVLLILLAIFLNRLHHKRLQVQKEKFEKEEAQLKYLHELEIKNNEKEIIQLKNERLETEVVYKNKELASTTMHLYKRGRLLGKIKEEITVATKKLPQKEDRADFIKVLKLISEEEKREDDWDQFAIHFDQVHNQFLQRMKTAYPELTATDLKICAYVKMSLSSKEIAQLLNISLKGVEVARYRLRKKLNLSSNIYLTDFINELAGKEPVEAEA